MKSASAWMVGLAALGVMAALSLPPRLKTMQSELQTRINATLADPRYQGVVALAKGQEVELYLINDFKGTDGQARLKAAAAAISRIKGLDGLTQQGGWWFGPVTTVSISDERMSLAALEEAKGVSLHVPEAPQAGAASASSASLAPTAHDLAFKCNGTIQTALAGRTLTFTATGGLSPDSEPVLDSLVAALRDCPAGIVVTINGLVQSGEDTGPQGAAFLRAQTIADGMVLRGYDPYRLTVQAVQKSLPKDGQGDGRQVAFLAVAR